MEARLVDTNVMLAANAIHRDLLGIADNGAEPQSPILRQYAYDALRQFEESDMYLVLDYENAIRDEYDRRMSYNHPQEYGVLTLQAKLDRGHVNLVTIDVSPSHFTPCSSEAACFIVSA